MRNYKTELPKLLRIFVSGVLAVCFSAHVYATSTTADPSAWFFKGVEPSQTAELLKRQAEAGQVEAQLNYAKYLYDRNEKSIAVVWLTEANNQGNIKAEYLLGLLYERGEGVAQDFDQSRYFFGKAADQAYPPAQYKLGKMLIDTDFDNPEKDNETTEEIKKIIARGVVLIRKSAASGYALSQYELGLLEYNGDLVKKDSDDALVNFKNAAAQGIAVSAYMAAICYVNGVGASKNIALARDYWQRTIELDGPNSDVGISAKLMLDRYGRRVAE